MTIIATRDLTETELEEIAAAEESSREQERRELAELRRSEYARVADPLFFGWQRGDNSKQAWLDACDRVREEHPYLLR